MKLMASLQTHCISVLLKLFLNIKSRHEWGGGECRYGTKETDKGRIR